MPTGTVTFLFTDIVGSTALWEHFPVEMRTAVARHDEIIRQAIASRGGHVFASGGDGVAAVFARADGAIGAAVLAQIGVAAETWPVTTPLQVRMGVHSGEADERDGDFFGAVVNRAARVMSVALGRQVLVSKLTSSLAGQLSEIDLIDVGERRLRGITDPIASQMPAPIRRGRVMSAWLNEVKPALKLMNVLTTATEAREMAVAAGIPSSRTRPDDCRVKRPCPAGALPLTGVVAIPTSSPSGH